MSPEALVVTLVIGSSLAAAVYRWATLPSGLFRTGPGAQPRPAASGKDATPVGNYPPPAPKRSAEQPSNVGLRDDRWLDWLAIAGLFAGLMYAFWLGSTPEGKRF